MISIASEPASGVFYSIWPGFISYYTMNKKAIPLTHSIVRGALSDVCDTPVPCVFPPPFHLSSIFQKLHALPLDFCTNHRSLELGGFCFCCTSHFLTGRSAVIAGPNSWRRSGWQAAVTHQAAHWLRPPRPRRRLPPLHHTHSFYISHSTTTLYSTSPNTHEMPTAPILSPNPKNSSLIKGFAEKLSPTSPRSEPKCLTKSDLPRSDPDRARGARS